MLPAYITREQVKRAFDVKTTARADGQVDRAIQAASRDVDGDLRRRFYPEDATFTLPRPRCRELFLDSDIDVDLVSLDTLTVDGTAVAAADRDLLPVDGPPFTRIEFANTIFFGTDRRPVSISGTWGFDDRTESAGQLAAAVDDTTTTTVDVSNSAVIGIGDLITVDSERMVVNGKATLDTTQDLSGGITASSAEVTLTVADGSVFAVGEELLVDSERVLVVDISVNDLVVRRAWDGSVLAGHSVGANVFAPRRLTVERGALGSTAATHTSGTAVVRKVYPGPVVAYAMAIAEHRYLKEVVGQQSETGTRTTPLDIIRDDARRGYQRLLLG